MRGTPAHVRKEEMMMMMMMMMQQEVLIMCTMVVGTIPGPSH